MKHAELRAIVHNVADSIASGIGLLIGYYEMDVIGEAARSDDAVLVIDILEGCVTKGTASEDLSKAIILYRDALARLCAKAGGSVEELHEASIGFSSDVLGHQFVVTIEDNWGGRSTTKYAGLPGKRPKVMDSLGRLRPMPSKR